LEGDSSTQAAYYFVLNCQPTDINLCLKNPEAFINARVMKFNVGHGQYNVGLEQLHFPVLSVIVAA
jgi:hypothetical protein